MKQPFDLGAYLKRKNMTAAELASVIGVHRSQATRWCKRGVPPERCVAVGEHIGIAPHVLRPDIFPAPAPHQEPSHG